jgi:hypothetical protein
VCSQSPSKAVCRWRQIDRIDREANQLSRTMKSSTSVNKLEATAQKFEQLTSQYTSLEGSEDAQLDVLVSLRLADLYKNFGGYLVAIGRKNPDLGQVLMAKGKESIRNGNNFYVRCKKIINASKLVSPVNKFCYRKKNPNKNEAFKWKRERKLANIKSSGQNQFKDIKKDIFSNYNGDNLMKLAYQFYSDGNYHHASAVSAYGLSAGGNVKAINTILGCSVLGLGYLNEAKYYLSNGTNYRGLKTRCSRELSSYEK